jgi:hypothetical protein
MRSLHWQRKTYSYCFSETPSACSSSADFKPVLHRHNLKVLEGWLSLDYTVWKNKVSATILGRLQRNLFGTQSLHRLRQVRVQNTFSDSRYKQVLQFIELLLKGFYGRPAGLVTHLRCLTITAEIPAHPADPADLADESPRRLMVLLTSDSDTKY